MNHALVIARRELLGRSRLFLLAAGLALLPFIASMMPGASNHRADVIGLTGAILGLALGLGTAIAIGNATVGHELTQRQLSFYFSKPVSATGLWIGKAAAGLIASIATFFIIAVPAFLAVSTSWRAGATDAGNILLIGVIGIVTLFFVSHATSTVVRSRSALVVVDLVLLAAAVGTLYAILRAVAFGGAVGHARTMLLAAAVAVLLVLIVAPARQLANGRTDVRRSHAAFSRALWPAVAAIVLLTTAYGAWLITPDPDDFAKVQLVQLAPEGDWLLVGGEVKHRNGYAATFAVNRSSGQSVRMPSPMWWGATFSRDGRTLAWLEPEKLFRFGPFRLYTRRLDVADARNRDSGIVVNSDDFVISDDGTRIAVLDGALISVYDLASRKLMASAKGVEQGQRHSCFFVTNDVVRVYATNRDGGRMSIFELNVATRSFARTGEVAGPIATTVSMSADGGRALLRDDAVFDGRTGALVAELPAWDAQQIRPRMLPDGRVARTGLAGNAIHLQLFDDAGAMRHDVVLTGIRNAMVSGATVDGKVIVLGSREVGKDRTTFVVDLAGGTVDRVLENVRGPWPLTYLDPRRVPFRNGLVAVDGEGRVVVYKHDGRAEARPLL